LTSLPFVRITRKGADRAASGHPWIFRSDIDGATDAPPGAVVRVVDHRQQTIGLAHYSSASQIALRMLGTDADLARRIAAAQRYREQVVTDSSGYRLVHGEADRLPGLVIDRYENYFAAQFLSQGMDAATEEIVEALQLQFGAAAVVARNDAAVRKLEGLPREVKILSGSLPEPVEIRLNGFRLEVNLLQGQKTGVFLDQRENYLAAARYGRGTALDCFTSTGGFALHLARVCERVEAVDSGAAVLAAAARNAENNQLENIDFKDADAFDVLASHASARRLFDIVVLDPPAFAKSKSQLAGAMRGYKDINLRALKLLGPGGVLVTCSCSHHMSEAMLLEVVAEASLQAGKTLRVLERRTQSQDHPILLTVPETHYLKCLILQVM
jgi:23S rRNA (cytosine1962-C5)-methyltransferase